MSKQGGGMKAVVAGGQDKALAVKLARAETRAAAAEKALDEAKLSGAASGKAASAAAAPAKMSAADAKKAKAVEVKMKQLEAKVSKLSDQLQTEKDKSAAAGAAAKDGAAAEREKKKLQADAEKKLKAAADETEKAAKLAEKKAAEAAELKDTLEAAEAELGKLNKDGAGASKELESLRAQAEQLAIVQAHEAELDASLKAQSAELGLLETRYKEQVTLRKKYYNMIEDMKGKIRVYARCRPMAKYEIEKECQPVVSFPDEYTVELKMEKGAPRQFAWDCAFTPASTQEETYEETGKIHKYTPDI
jgi:chromosome segregation ATPase